MEQAAIVGVGSTPYYFRGESQPQTVYELIGKAAISAVADAGLEMDDIDGFAFYSAGFDAALITQMLGVPEINFASVVSGHGGGSAGVLDLAALAVLNGRAKAVMCIGACQQSTTRFGTALARMAPTPEGEWRRTAGLKGPGHAMGVMIRRHMHLYGTRREAFAEVVMASREY